ncbi:sensor domain-containing protein [Aeromicrobium fastidiosum]|nr:EAL domain-containing protein [Aeromicrobium fastidiosum]MBP2391666.1 diguanylate cyclase (GGDEF)-like protein/PAS domain S-box-containing protein [Aeromicrobium fastidiosum]
MHAPNVVPTATLSRTGEVLRADSDLALMLDVPLDEVVGRQLESLGRSAPDVEDIRACVLAASGGQTAEAQVSLRSLDANGLHVQLVATPAGDQILVVVIDETERIHEERDLASSHRRWQSLVRNAADIVFTIQDDGTLTSVTSALRGRMGWDADDVVGVEGLDFVHPDDRRRAYHAWIAVSERGSRQETLELRLAHADGSVSWTRLVITDLRDDPDVAAVVGNATDITGKKLAEEARRADEARFRSRFEQSRVPQTMHGLDDTLTAVNDAFCALVGRSREELVGQPMATILHSEDGHSVHSRVTEVAAQGIDTMQVERTLRGTDDQAIPVRATLTVLRGDDGEATGYAVSIEDLRPLHDSERARQELQQLFDVVAERSRDFVTLHDASGRTLYASPPGRRMFGPGYADPATDHSRSVHPDDIDQVTATWLDAQTTTEPQTMRFRCKGADGEWMWVEHTSINLLDTGIRGILSTIRDVTVEVSTQQALSLSEARYRAIAETAEEGILVISPHGTATYANARLSTMLALPLDVITGSPVWSVLDGDARDFVIDRVSTRHTRGVERYRVPYKHPDGSRHVLRVSASPMPDIDGQRQGSLAMITDITESLQRIDELRHAAEHDALTDLPNRSTLMTHLESLDLGHRSGVALLFVDLDHFKEVNDGRGHTAGDGVLTEVADRIVATVGPEHMVSRFGGDEFVVVMKDVDEPAARTMAGRILSELTLPYAVGHHMIRVGATIGVARSPAESGDDLLRFADSAMYAAKAGGRGRVRVFDAELAAQTEERSVVSSELLDALENDDLELHYQPVVDISTGEVVGVEALARWHHPTYGEIRPERFVALAEMNASSTDVDRWVVRRALRDISELKADLTMPEDAYVSINLSGQSLSDEGLAAYIVDAVEEAGLQPSEVMLEITESALMTDQDMAITILQQLGDRGFDIALDDFGTGYSSMAYLRDLPINVLKIDRGFIEGIPEDTHSLAIVRSLIELARSLDIKVVAEGVETQAHLDELSARGCGLGQGWLWSPAVSVEALRASRILTDRFAAAAVDTRAQ